MKIGVICEAGLYDIDDEWRSRFNINSFSISVEQLSFSQIFYSAFATPARYVMELFRRLHMLGCGNDVDGCFIFNPFICFDQSGIQSILRTLSLTEKGDDPLVLAGKGNFPVGYYFPSRISPEEERYLTLLSTANAELDQQLLNRIFFVESDIGIVEVDIQTCPGNGFLFNEDLAFIYEWTAASAISLLNGVFPRKETWCPCRSIDGGFGFQFRELRDVLPFSAFMPHHAGDVLFYALAARDTVSHISRIVVNRQYANILDEVIPEYGVYTIEPSSPKRVGSGGSDEQYFLDFAPDLPPFSFYYYCRQARNYNLSEFNLIDHFGFALGQSFFDRKDLISVAKKEPVPFKPAIPEHPLRILLHFDAGWGLKVYPEHFQQVLVQNLLLKGIEITILGTEDRDFGSYRSVKFTDLESLKGLLKSHHLLVGSDSFPSHYAAHVLGLPTICLFGPTKPVNSDARISSRYRYLERELPCRPCCHVDYCITHSKPWCNNFISPEQLLEELFAMLESNYGLGNTTGKVEQ